MSVHPRFYVPPASWSSDQLTLDESESHHAIDVLRLQIGSRVAAFAGNGIEAMCEIESANPKGVVLKIITQSTTPPLNCRITLAQAVPKGKNMELIIQKATELGASAIVPLLSDRSVIRLAASEAKQKQMKWRETAIEACKQCGQNWLPHVAVPLGLKDYFAQMPRFDLMLIASLQPDARDLKHWMASITTPVTSALVAVGPEGDFTPAELGLARSAGCLPLSLGPVILRTETAAIYSLSILAHELR